MARGARLVLIAAALAPLPLLAAVSWSGDADASRGLPKLVVSSRAGDLYVGDSPITTDGTDTEPDWSPDRRWIAFVRQDRASARRASTSSAATAAASGG